MSPDATHRSRALTGALVAAILTIPLMVVVGQGMDVVLADAVGAAEARVAERDASSASAAENWDVTELPPPGPLTIAPPVGDDIEYVEHDFYD